MSKDESLTMNLVDGFPHNPVPSDDNPCLKTYHCALSNNHFGACRISSYPMSCHICGHANRCLSCDSYGTVHGKTCKVCEKNKDLRPHGLEGCVWNLKKDIEELRRKMDDR